MTIQSINITDPNKNNSYISFKENERPTFGHINMKKDEKVKEYAPKATKKDKLLAATGAVTGVGIALATIMKRQKIKNPLKINYKVTQMLSMAAAGNIGGITFSSIGEHKEDIRRKWKEGAFQMVLTSAPMLLVDQAIKLCSKSKSPKINNNFTKIIASALGVFIGSNTAIAIFNALRSEKETKKPERKLKLIDMIANLDDFVAICVLAKIPFANKIHIERALPVIYSFCGFRSGTGDRN